MSKFLKLLEKRDAFAEQQERFKMIVLELVMLDGIMLVCLAVITAFPEANPIPGNDRVWALWGLCFLLGVPLIASVFLIARCFYEIRQIDRAIARINDMLWGTVL